jgi:uncharacterized protein (TIGR01777 family)
MAKILIAGGSGLIGQELCNSLQDKGYEVAVLSRSKNPDTSVPGYFWDIDRGEIDRAALNNCDYIIHLAGANIGEKRWSRKRKQEILNSRIKSTELIFNNIDKNNSRLKAIISASAIGYYGAITSPHIYDESDPPAGDFLGQTCRAWEQGVDIFTEMGIRVVRIRTGIVLSRQGGALAKLMRPIKFGLGAPLGQGNQYMPWIHMDDLCAIYIHALENKDMHGAYNAVAPEHITNKAFTNKIAQILNKPYWFPNIPAATMKMLFGEMAVMLLKGSRISSDKIRNAGFTFQYPDLDSALQDLFSK